MIRRTLAIFLTASILTSHLGTALTLRVNAGETDALTALKVIEQELEKGKIPSGSITEANFIIPEGFPVELAKRLWLFIAQLVSTGCSRDEVSRAIVSANDTLQLPSRIRYELKNYTIIPKYGEARLIQSNDGSISVEIPYRVVDSRGKDVDADTVKYESNGTSLFHFLHRYPKRRTYLVRAIDPDGYALTFIDLKTGEVFNKTVRMNIGLFSNLAQGGFFESFIVAVPGHFEETREATGSQVREFKVLLPAHDPLVVDTSISQTRVKIGDVITVGAQIRNPQEAKDFKVLLGARFSDEKAFEAWAPPPAGFPQGSGCPVSYLYLRARKPGVYQVTIYFAFVEPKNLDVVFWNGEKTVTYVVTVLPEAPKLRVELEAHALAKFANLSITLVNTGGQEATGVKLFITGDVEEKQLDVGRVWHSWEGNVVTRLLSPIARVNVTAVYHDLDGKMLVNTALTTVSTTNFVTPEEWRTYLVEVPGYEETRKVFIPGCRAATHVKLYLARSNLAAPYASSFFKGLALIPVSPSGFTLTLENASSIAAVSQRIPEVRYMLLDVKPGFLCERVLREDEVKKLFHLGEDERLEPGRIPAGYEVKLLKEEVLNQSETVTVDDDLYERLKYNNWEDPDYKYEDTGAKKWDLNKAAARVSHGKTIELVYHPLLCQGELVKGVLVKNYAARETRYELEILQGPMVEASPENVMLSVPAYGSTPLNIIRLSSTYSPILIRMRCGSRIVASLWVYTGGRVPEFWRGFWDGINEKLPGIIITTTLMIVLAAPTGGGSLLACVKKLLASGVIPALMIGGAALNAREFLEAHSAYVKMDEAAEILEGFSQRAAYVGYMGFYAFLQGVKQSIKENQALILGETGLDLVGDFTIRDVLTAFGKERANEYERGRAVGRLVGAAASFASYTSIHYRFLSDGPRLLSWSGKIKEFMKGVYKWVTPPIWDLGVIAGRLAAGEIAASLAFSEQSRRLKDYLNSVREGEEPLSALLKSLKFSDEYIGKALDVAGGLKLSEEAFLSLLRAYGETVGRLSEEDLDTFLENIGKIGGRSRQCAENLLRCMQEAEDDGLEQVILKVIPELAQFNAESLEEIGRVFSDLRNQGKVVPELLYVLANKQVKSGDQVEIFRRIVKDYLDIKDAYGIKIAEVFVKSILNKLELTEVWEWAVKSGAEIFTAESDAELKFIDVDGEKYTLVVSDDGSVYVRHKSIYNKYLVKAIYDEIIRDKNGRTIAIVKCIEHAEGTARLVLERNIPNNPIVFIDNEATILGKASRIIEVEQGQTSFEIRKTLQLILGTERYEALKNDMENKMAVIGLAYRKEDKIDVMWTSRTFLELEAAGGVDEILGIAIVRAEGIGFTGGATTLRLNAVDEKKFLTIISEGIERRFEVKAEFRRPQYGGATLDIQFDSGRRIGFRIGLGEHSGYVEVLPAVGRGDKYDILPKDTSIEFYEEYPSLGEEKQKNILIFLCKEDSELKIHALSLTDPYITAKELADLKHTVAKHSCMRSLGSIGIKIVDTEFILDLKDDEKLITERESVIFDFIGKMGEGDTTNTVAIEVKHGYEENTDRLVKNADIYLLVTRNRGWILVYYFFDEPRTGATKNLLSRLTELARMYPGSLRIYIEGKGWIVK
ncbi:MAG: hypothetical protein N3F08_00585 [Crenarchaeota archaeon]|nr:hypothetical protein [Thermoproteota archaeon]